MQPTPQLAPTNQIAPPRLLAGQTMAAAQSKTLPNATNFLEQLATALAACVATAKPAAAGGAALLTPAGPVAAAEPAAAQVATDQGAQQIAPVQTAPVQGVPDPVQTTPVPAVGTLPLPPSTVVNQQQPDGVAQRARPPHTDRRESKSATTATTTEDATGTDQSVAIAIQPLPLALPVPVDAMLPAQQGPGNATATGDAETTPAIAAKAVDHVPGAKQTIVDAAPSDVQPAGTHAPHRADLLPASTQPGSDQLDTSQSTTTQATTPSATQLPLHPLSRDTATAPAPASASAAPASATNAHVASPAAQVAPALVAIGHAPDGAQRLTMRLAPPELGQVQIRIDRPPDAPARVEITVEKTETLTLLLRDQPQLLHALDQAGVRPEGRSVTFHIVAPEPPPRMDATSVPSPSGATSNGLAGEYSQSASRQGGQSPQQQQTAADGSDEAAQSDAAPPAWARWSRAGLDITA